MRAHDIAEPYPVVGLDTRLGHTTSDAAMIDQHAAKGRDRALAQ